MLFLGYPSTSSDLAKEAYKNHHSTGKNQHLITVMQIPGTEIRS